MVLPKRTVKNQITDNMFSDDDYEGFAFVQDVTCNMSDKAGIPDSWIIGQSINGGCIQEHETTQKYL